uniref:Myb/SANT-like domain-containing protein n=1 Tax=Arundo donax TaxID=35708 RepID=A0A0A9DR58_ARUDO
MSPIKPGHASGQDAIFWSNRMNEYLIDSLLHQQAIGNRGEGKFFSVAYDNIINGVGDRFGVVINRTNIKNRLKYIKESFNECKNLMGEDSSIKWNSESRRFHADLNVWRELVERKPEAKKWMTKTINHYDRLMELFGKDREKRPAAENSKSSPKKKARKEPPKERLQRTAPTSLELNVAENSNQTVNESPC